MSFGMQCGMLEKGSTLNSFCEILSKSFQIFNFPFWNMEIVIPEIASGMQQRSPSGGCWYLGPSQKMWWPREGELMGYHPVLSLQPCTRYWPSLCLPPLTHKWRSSQYPCPRFNGFINEWIHGKWCLAHHNFSVNSLLELFARVSVVLC